MSKPPWRGAAKPKGAAVKKITAAGLPLALFAAAMALLLSPPAVRAHALLVRADPQPNAELTQPPAAIQFWFSEPLEETFTGARILDAAGTEIPTGAPQFDPEDPTHLTLPLESIEPGVYTVVWQTLSSVDGHEWVGSFPLTILNPDGTRPAGTAVQVRVNRQQGLPPLTDSFLRWLSLLGAALLAGPLAVRWFLAQSRTGKDPESLIETLTRSTALVGVLLLLASGWLQFLFKSLRLEGTDGFLELLLATRPGRLLLIRQTLLAGVIPLLYPNGWAKILFRRPVPPDLAPRLWSILYVLHTWIIGFALGGTIIYGPNLWIFVAGILFVCSAWSELLFGGEQTWHRAFPQRTWATLLTAAALFTFAASSHAAAASGSGWAVAADFAHLVAAAVWAGGLIFLALLLFQLHHQRTLPDPDWMVLLLTRYSLSAQIAVFILALTGLFGSFVQLPDASSLFTTTYGRVLLIKLVIVAAILALAYFNNRAVKRAQDTVANTSDLSRFTRRVAAEAGMAAVLFISVAVLVQTPTPNLPPPTAPAAPSLPFNEMAYDGDLAVHLQITPNQVGHNRYWVHLSHPDSSDIGEVQLVRLFFSHESGDMGQARLDLVDLGEDAFAAEGAFLNRDGQWNLSVYVRRRGMNDALAEITVPVPSAQTVQQISRSPWRNPVPWLPAETVVGALLIALSLVPLLWRRPLLRASRPLYIVLAMAALFFLLSGTLLALTALL
ncbi:MAG: copper resistance protein CopC [Caldilineaceae bacterium]|nr:copper resistance protein CopC [Caldilineaceae bacterium]